MNTILICSDFKSTKMKTVVNIQLDCFNDFLKQLGIVVSSKSFSTKNKKCVLRSILIPAIATIYSIRMVCVIISK